MQVVEEEAEEAEAAAVAAMGMEKVEDLGVAAVTKKEMMENLPNPKKFTFLLKE